MEKNWLEQINVENQIQVILKTNDYTNQFGLAITKLDAKLLTQERKNSLKEKKRVEFGGSIIPKLIYEFCDSAYLNQSNYMETLIQLQDIFYLFKNEMQDEITDDELIHFMKEQFETVCFGDVDYLAGTCLENFAQAIRAGYQDYRRTDGYGAYHSLDEVSRWDYNLYLEALNNLM